MAVLDNCNTCYCKKANWYCEGCLPDTETVADEDYRANGMGMMPSFYKGDLIVDNTYHCSGCITLPDYTVLMFFPKVESEAISGRTNLGKVITVKNNQILFEQDNIVLGHGNGITWDNKRKKVIITPLFSYSNGTRSAWNTIIEYDYDPTQGLVNETEVSVSRNFMGVGYDYVSGITYLTGWGGNDIYTYDGTTDTFALNTKLPPSNHRIAYNQGFAVYGDYMYLSGSDNRVGVYKVEDGSFVREFMVDIYDYNGYYKLGELEDFDFKITGDLYAARFTAINNHVIDAFYTYIPVCNVIDELAYQGYNSTNHTFRINNNSIATFRNTFTELKHLDQLNILASNINMINRVECNFTTDIGDVVLNVPVVLDVLSMKVKTLTAFKSLVLYVADDRIGGMIFTDTTTGYHIRIHRLGELRIVGGGHINFLMPTGVDEIHIDIASWLPRIDIRQSPQVNGTYDATKFFIAGSNFESMRGLYSGATQFYTFT